MKTKFIKVTTSRIYVIEDYLYNPTGIDNIIKELFYNFNINTTHATRDSCEIGNTIKVETISEITEKYLTEYIKDLNKQRKE